MFVIDIIAFIDKCWFTPRDENHPQGEAAIIYFTFTNGESGADHRISKMNNLALLWVVIVLLDDEIIRLHINQRFIIVQKVSYLDVREAQRGHHVIVPEHHLSLVILRSLTGISKHGGIEVKQSPPSPDREAISIILFSTSINIFVIEAVVLCRSIYLIILSLCFEGFLFIL